MNRSQTVHIFLVYYKYVCKHDELEVIEMENLKILVVDDESRMRKLVKDFLSKKGYEVLEAGDGEEAIDVFVSNKDIALLILDAFYLLALICLVYAYFRMLSRNISRRYQENQWFESRFGGIKRWFAKQKGYMSLRKNYRIFVCPSCHQKVKVPKGKGKISIHCPKCHTDFIKRS